MSIKKLLKRIGSEILMDNSSTQINQSSRPALTGHDRHTRKKLSVKKLIKLLILAVIAGLIILGGVFLYRSTTSSSIDGGKYQAVFLTNGQVYFGKLKIQNGGYMVLTNIYYLQSTADKTAEEIQAAAGSDTTSVELIKLGSEIHGPDDQMVINVDQVLFFENLKVDGRVAQSIAQYESKQ